MYVRKSLERVYIKLHQKVVNILQKNTNLNLKIIILIFLTKMKAVLKYYYIYR